MCFRIFCLLVLIVYVLCFAWCSLLHWLVSLKLLVFVWLLLLSVVCVYCLFGLIMLEVVLMLSWLNKLVGLVLFNVWIGVCLVFAWFTISVCDLLLCVLFRLWVYLLCDWFVVWLWFSVYVCVLEIWFDIDKLVVLNVLRFVLIDVLFMFALWVMFNFGVLGLF